MAIPKPVLSSDPTLRCVTCDSAEVAAHVPGLQVPMMRGCHTS